MGNAIKTVAFDADDTLWQNESFFRLTQVRFQALLSDYADPNHLEQRLIAAETRNIAHYGYGIKGFTLSMIETAIEVTEDRLPARIIRDILDTGREMLAHPIELLPHVETCLTFAADNYHVLMVTKGDLLHQEQKLAQSGLGDYFDGVEVVSEKTAETYAQSFARQGVEARHTIMIGNSMRSDILPVLELGGWAVHVPHELSWAYEHAAPPEGHPRFREASDLARVADLLREIG